MLDKRHSARDDGLIAALSGEDSSKRVKSHRFAALMKPMLLVNFDREVIYASCMYDHVTFGNCKKYRIFRIVYMIRRLNHWFEHMGRWIRQQRKDGDGEDDLPPAMNQHVLESYFSDPYQYSERTRKGIQSRIQEMDDEIFQSVLEKNGWIGRRRMRLLMRHWNHYLRKYPEEAEGLTKFGDIFFTQSALRRMPRLEVLLFAFTNCKHGVQTKSQAQSQMEISEKEERRERLAKILQSYSGSDPRPDEMFPKVPSDEENYDDEKDGEEAEVSSRREASDSRKQRQEDPREQDNSREQQQEDSQDYHDVVFFRTSSDQSSFRSLSPTGSPDRKKKPASQQEAIASEQRRLNKDIATSTTAKLLKRSLTNSEQGSEMPPLFERSLLSMDVNRKDPFLDVSALLVQRLESASQSVLCPSTGSPSGARRLFKRLALEFLPMLFKVLMGLQILWAVYIRPYNYFFKVPNYWYYRTSITYPGFEYREESTVDDVNQE